MKKLVRILLAVMILICLTATMSMAAKKKYTRILTVRNAQIVNGGNNNIIVVPKAAKKKKKKSKNMQSDDEFAIAIGSKAKFSWSEQVTGVDRIPSKKNGLANMTSPIKVTSKTDKIYLSLGEEFANLSMIFTRILDESGDQVAEFDYADAATVKLTPEPKDYYIEYKVRADSLPKKGKKGFKLGNFDIPIGGGLSIPIGNPGENEKDSDERTYKYFYILLSMKSDAKFIIHEPEKSNDMMKMLPLELQPTTFDYKIQSHDKPLIQ